MTDPIFRQIDRFLEDEERDEHLADIEEEYDIWNAENDV